MQRIATCVGIAMATVLISNLARAQEDYSRRGCYLGLGGVAAVPIRGEDALEDETEIIFGVSNASIDESLGLNARGGCRGKWGGGELHFEWIEGYDIMAAGRNFNVNAWALTADGKVYPLAGLEDSMPPVARRFQPFATVGFGYMSWDLEKLRDFLGDAAVANLPDPTFRPGGLEDWDFIVRLGGGSDVYATENIAITIDATYVLPLSNDMHDLDYVSIGWGFMYRF